jgi:fructokinase
MIDTCRTAATITFDPNVRPALIKDPTGARAQIESVVTRADVVKASDEDLAWLELGEPPERVAANWLTLGPAIVAVTFGSRGAYAMCADGDVRIPAHPARVVDTVGAGDAFMVGLIDALWDLVLLGGHRRQQLGDIRSDALREVLQAASLSSPGD